MNQSLKMLAGCLIPLLLIFLLPALGVSGETTYLLFFVLMFACHLFMMGRHGHGQRHHGNAPGEEHRHDSAQS